MSQLIKLSEVIKMTGLSAPSIYRCAAKKQFPKPIKLTPNGRSSAWVLEEVQQWINDRITASRSEEAA